MNGAGADTEARRSGHDPAAPRLDPRWPTSPKLLSALREAVEGARRIFTDRHRAFPELLRRRRGRASKAKGTTVTWYPLKRKRSERSEAHARVLAFMVARCDLVTLRVGAYRKGGVVAFYDRHRLAEGVGMELSQLDRVLSDFKLEAANYIHRHQKRELIEDPNGDRYSGHVAELKLTLDALEACGLSRERREVLLRQLKGIDLKRERRERRRQLRMRPPAGTLLARAIDPALADVRQGVPEVRDEDRLAYTNVAHELRQQHPDWSPSRIEWEARKRLYGPPPDSQR